MSLSEEEFAGLLQQCLRHPADYAEVSVLLTEGGFTVSRWMGVVCVGVGDRLLSVAEAYRELAARPELGKKVYEASLRAWR